MQSKPFSIQLPFRSCSIIFKIIRHDIKVVISELFFLLKVIAYVSSISQSVNTWCVAWNSSWTWTILVQLLLLVVIHFKNCVSVCTFYSLYTFCAWSDFCFNMFNRGILKLLFTVLLSSNNLAWRRLWFLNSFNVRFWWTPNLLSNLRSYWVLDFFNLINLFLKSLCLSKYEILNNHSIFHLF